MEGIKKAPSQLLEEAQLKSLQISRRSFAVNLAPFLHLIFLFLIFFFFFFFLYHQQLLGRKFSAWRTRKAELPSSVGFSSCRDLALCYHHFARSCQGCILCSFVKTLFFSFFFFQEMLHNRPFCHLLAKGRWNPLWLGMI